MDYIIKAITSLWRAVLPIFSFFLRLIVQANQPTTARQQYADILLYAADQYYGRASNNQRTLF